MAIIFQNFWGIDFASPVRDIERKWKLIFNVYYLKKIQGFWENIVSLSLTGHHPPLPLCWPFFWVLDNTITMYHPAFWWNTECKHSLQWLYSCLIFHVSEGHSLLLIISLLFLPIVSVLLEIYWAFTELCPHLLDAISSLLLKAMGRRDRETER